MELEVNERGNLVRPIPKLLHSITSCAASAAMTYGLGLLNGIDMLEILPPPLFVVPFVVFCILVMHVLAIINGEIEFDKTHGQVVMGKNVITSFKDIRQIEICESGTNDEAGYAVTLRLGVSRSYPVLSTNSDTDASLAAADISRVVDKPVVVVR